MRFTLGGYPERQQDSLDIKNPKCHINRYENNLSVVKIFFIWELKKMKVKVAHYTSQINWKLVDYDR